MTNHLYNDLRKDCMLSLSSTVNNGPNDVSSKHLVALRGRKPAQRPNRIPAYTRSTRRHINTVHRQACKGTCHSPKRMNIPECLPLAAFHEVCIASKAESSRPATRFDLCVFKPPEPEGITGTQRITRKKCCLLRMMLTGNIKRDFTYRR